METKKCNRCFTILPLNKFKLTQYKTLSKACYKCSVDMSYNTYRHKLERFMFACSESLDDIIEMYNSGSIESISNIDYYCSFNDITFDMFIKYLSCILDKKSLEENLIYLIELVKKFNNDEPIYLYNKIKNL
jgi:hypothetical protein